MLNVPTLSTPIVRTRVTRGPATTSAGGVDPSIKLGPIQIGPFVNEAVSPSVFGIFGLPFANEEAIGPSVIDIFGLPFADDNTE